MQLRSKDGAWITLFVTSPGLGRGLHDDLVMQFSMKGSLVVCLSIDLEWVQDKTTILHRILGETDLVVYELIELIAGGR